jgi:hypothetical protein
VLAGAVLLFAFAFVLVFVLDGGNIMLIMFVCGCIGVGWREGS